jgi:hypothetical protein
VHRSGSPPSRCGHGGVIEAFTRGAVGRLRPRGIRQEVAVAGDDHLPDRGRVLHRLQHRIEAVGGDDHLGAEVAELVLEFSLFEQRTAGADHRPELLDREVRDDVLRAVVEEQRDPVAPGDTHPRQRPGKRIAHPVQRRVADGVAVPVIGDLLGLPARMLAQVLVQRLFPQVIPDHRNQTTIGVTAPSIARIAPVM